MPEALEFAREELRPSVSEAPVSIGILNDGDDDVVLLDTAGLQFLDELCIEGCLLLLGSLPACDPDEDDVLGAIDTEPGVLDDEVRFGVLLVDSRTSITRNSSPLQMWSKSLS